MHNIENLNAMSAYCEDTCSCRRSMLLQHFGEVFTVSECRGSCDNCKANTTGTVKEIDMTNTAQMLTDIVRCSQNALSLSLLTGVFRGSMSSAIKNKHLDNHPKFGVGKSLKVPIGKVESVVRKLINMVRMVTHMCSW